MFHWFNENFTFQMGKIVVESPLVHSLFKCSLCNGLIRSATVINECLHRCKFNWNGKTGVEFFSWINLVCKFCITNYLDTNNHKRCPTCHIEIDNPKDMLKYVAWKWVTDVQLISFNHHSSLDQISFFNDCCTNCFHLCFKVRWHFNPGFKRLFYCFFDWFLGEITCRPSLLSLSTATGNISTIMMMIDDIIYLLLSFLKNQRGFILIQQSRFI